MSTTSTAPETLREARAADLRAERLRLLERAITERKAAQATIDLLVPKLHRHNNVSWGTLAALLGVTRQAVSLRYGKAAR